MDHSNQGFERTGRQGQSPRLSDLRQVNDYLPDEAVNPEKLDNLLMALDEAGIELVNEPPADGPQPSMVPRRRPRQPRKRALRSRRKSCRSSATIRSGCI